MQKSTCCMSNLNTSRKKVRDFPFTGYEHVNECLCSYYALSGVCLLCNLTLGWTQVDPTQQGHKQTQRVALPGVQIYSVYSVLGAHAATVVLSLPQLEQLCWRPALKGVGGWSDCEQTLDGSFKVVLFRGSQRDTGCWDPTVQQHAIKLLQSVWTAQ